MHPQNVGSSITSFAYEPHEEETQKRQKRVCIEDETLAIHSDPLGLTNSFRLILREIQISEGLLYSLKWEMTIPTSTRTSLNPVSFRYRFCNTFYINVLF